jgi:hypothetical protein
VADLGAWFGLVSLSFDVQILWKLALTARPA